MQKLLPIVNMKYTKERKSEIYIERENKYMLILEALDYRK